jgi:hypothetical protein
MGDQDPCDWFFLIIGLIIMVIATYDNPPIWIGIGGLITAVAAGRIIKWA